MSITKDFCILQGKTFERVVRWEEQPIVYKTITGITKAAPAVLTVPSHDVPPGWRVAVTNVLGMTQINARSTPPRAVDYHQATVIDANSISLNNVNAAGFSEWTSGGVLQYYTPASLAGATARMTIKNRVGGTELFSLTTANGRIVIDEDDYMITLTILAADTEDITTWTRGVYDLEIVIGAVVKSLASGVITVSREVTT